VFRGPLRHAAAGSARGSQARRAAQGSAHGGAGRQSRAGLTVRPVCPFNVGMASRSKKAAAAVTEVGGTGSRIGNASGLSRSAIPSAEYRQAPTDDYNSARRDRVETKDKAVTSVTALLRLRVSLTFSIRHRGSPVRL